MDITLKCYCGLVEGVLFNADKNSGTRAVCCCDDCQAFAEHLTTDTEILDEFGGTEIFQTSQAQVRIHKGVEHLRCLRLTSKGIRRWYTACCGTPVGNTLSAGLPFVGVLHTFVSSDVDRDAALGPVRAYVQTRHARGTPTYSHSAPGFPLGITLRIARKMLIWKLRGWHKPSVFFAPDGRTIVKPEVLTADNG